MSIFLWCVYTPVSGLVIAQTGEACEIAASLTDTSIACFGAAQGQKCSGRAEMQADMVDGHLCKVPEVS